MPFCTGCGSRNEEGARFCVNCGSPVSAVAIPNLHTGAPPPRQKMRIAKKFVLYFLPMIGVIWFIISVASVQTSTPTATTAPAAGPAQPTPDNSAAESPQPTTNVPKGNAPLPPSSDAATAAGQPEFDDSPLDVSQSNLFEVGDVGAVICPSLDTEEAYLVAMVQAAFSLPIDSLLKIGDRPTDIASMPLMQISAAQVGCVYLAPGTRVAVVNQVSVRILPDTGHGLEVPGPGSPLTNLAMVQILGQGRGFISPDMVVRNRQPRATTAEPQPESEPQTQPAPQATPESAQPEARQSTPPEATPAAEPPDNEGEANIRNAVAGWMQAFRARDAARLAECYAPEVEQYFRKKNVSRSQVQKYIESGFGRINSINKYEISNLKVDFLSSSEAPNRATATFDKQWDTSQTDGKTFSGEEIERLTFSKTDEGWKIVREDELNIIRATRQ